MGIFFFFYFLPLTIGVLVIGGGCLLYLTMGIGQLITGIKEENHRKKRGGAIAILITLVVLLLAVKTFFHLVM